MRSYRSCKGKSSCATRYVFTVLANLTYPCGLSHLQKLIQRILSQRHEIGLFCISPERDVRGELNAADGPTSRSDLGGNVKISLCRMVLVFLVITALGVLAVASSQAKRSKRSSKVSDNAKLWEYKSIVKILSYSKIPLGDSQVTSAKCYDGRTQLPCDSMLPTLGNQGWELVGVLGESLTGGNRDWAGTTTAETFFFKKPKA